MKLLPVTLTLGAALSGGVAHADGPRVAVDIAPIHSLVARVMAGVGAPDLVIPAEASPHEYNLRPSEAAALQDADIVVWLGADLTPWLDNAVDTLAADATVLTLLEAPGTTLLDMRESALFEAHAHGDDDHGDDHHGEVHHDDDHHADDHNGEEHHGEEAGHDDHHHGEDHDDHADHSDHGEKHDDHGEEHDEHHGEGHDDHAEHDDHRGDHEDDHADAGHAGHDHGEHDPHAWLSLTNSSLWLDLIAEQLSTADPANADLYASNAAEARADLTALRAEVSAVLEPHRGANFVVFHDAYQYFEAEFDMPASGAISLSDASDPSPARIAEIQGRIAEQGITCVLAEPQFNPGLVATVLDGTQAEPAVIDPLGAAFAPGPDHYTQTIRAMATALADCL